MFTLPFHNINPIALQLGPLSVHWYGLSYAAGFIFALIYTQKLAANQSLHRNNSSPVSPLHASQFLLWGVIGVILGGRLGYALFYNFPFFSQNPLQVFALWNGGLSFHGGLVGLALASFLFAKRSGIPFLPLADLYCAAAPFGLFCGRIANFINGELWGKPSSLPWAMTFPEAGPQPRHPSQLYEALLEGAVLFILIQYLVKKRRLLHYHGLSFAVFLAGYAVSRSIVELFFREPDRHIGYLFGPISMGFILTIPLLLGAALLAQYSLKRP